MANKDNGSKDETEGPKDDATTPDPTQTPEDSAAASSSDPVDSTSETDSYGMYTTSSDDDADPAIAEKAAAEDSTDPAAVTAPEVPPAETAPDAPAADTTSDTTPAGTTVVRKGTGAVTVVVLVLIALLVGLLAAPYIPAQYYPGGLPRPITQADFETQLAEVRDSAGRAGTDIEDLRAQVAEAGVPQELTDRLAALEEQVAALPENGGADVAPLTEEIDSLQAEVATLTERLASVEEGGVATGPSPELEELTAQLQQQMQDNQALAERLESAATEAGEVSTAVTARAAASDLLSAIDRGAPYAAPLDTISQQDGVEVPEVLSAHAETGVPTQSRLERLFPAAARDALDASVRATMGDGAMDRVGAFVRSQLRPRSLEPREGDDPDAVLSRAEAKLASGELDGALQEIATLPEAGQAAMSDWVAEATARRDAQAAAISLAQSLES